MVTIHIDFTDNTEVSYIEGLELLKNDSSASFSTNCLSFFVTKSYTKYPSDNVVIIDKCGKYVDRNELMSNKNNTYIDRHMREGHNIYKMLIADVFTWKQPHKIKE